MEYEQANAHIGHKDEHGRILAYVCLNYGTLLNTEIIRQGFGNACTRFPFAYMDQF